MKPLGSTVFKNILDFRKVIQYTHDNYVSHPVESGADPIFKYINVSVAKCMYLHISKIKTINVVLYQFKFCCQMYLHQTYKTFQAF